MHSCVTVVAASTLIGNMVPPIPAADLPREAYPITIEAMRFITGAVVWRRVVEAPLQGEKAAVSIPPLRKQLGHPVGMRWKFANGETHEASTPKLPG